MMHIEKLIHLWLSHLNVSENYITFFRDSIYFLGITLFTIIVNFIIKKVIVATLYRIAKKTETEWDDFLFERKVFQRLSHLAPAAIIYHLSPYIYPDYKGFVILAQVIAKLYMLFTLLFTIDALLNALHDIYETFDVSKIRPIKGYLQVVKIIVYIIGSIFALSFILNKSPMFLLTGLGALTAVLLLVFKDVILGFVASIQLTANDMIRPGDWIAMPKAGADGTVIEMNLTTIKVQNWDKTITTIPTYSLISDSFQNWRGMQESGVRRIKKSISIDMNTIRFCDKQLLEKFEKVHLLKDYINNLQAELNAYNTSHNVDNEVLINGRRQTNIGVFRAYLEAYLRNNENIDQSMTLIVRQLEPVEKGLPIEMYMFSKIQDMDGYETLQANIFDHILAVLPEFDLAVFQNPSGRDFQKIGK